ncbi:MAG: hypothetical protein AB1403_18935 [Candidatus Riflebacteria bacterium]
MSISAAAWLIFKWLFIFSAAFAATAAIIALFHPLRFNFSFRSTIRGQRGEVWFSYLFRIFRIGVIASPHTQDLVLKIFFWQKLLHRNTRPRKKPPVTRPPEEPLQPVFSPEKKDSDVAEEQTSAAKPMTEIITEPVKEPVSAQPEETKPQLPTSPDQGTTKETQEPSVLKTPKVESAAETPAEPSQEITAKSEPLPPEAQISEEKNQAIPEKPRAESIEASIPEKITPISELDPFARQSNEETPGSPKPEEEKTAGKTEESWQKKFRNLRRRLTQKYNQARYWLRFAGRKYRLLSPIFWKFWARSKKGFRIEKPALACRYALHEPYLTGMFQGNLAIFSGMLQRFGIEFVPVPVFTGPTIYGRGKMSLVLLPYRFIFALIGLFFERLLWSEAWQLFKWYRARKSTV